jgi:hypothetical protein
MEPDMTDPAAEIEAEPPVVDKEGQPVTQTPDEAGPTPDQPPGFPGGGAPQGDPLPAADPASPAAPSTDAPEGGPTPEPAAPVAAPQQPGEEPTAPPAQEPATEPPAPAEQPPAAPPAAEPPPADPPAQTAAPAASGNGQQPSPASPAGQGQGTGTGRRRQGQGAGARGGTPQLRYYKLLYATGPKTWTEHELKFDKGKEPAGVTIKTDDQGERWMECRNNEHALKVAFAILGNPADGVTIFPCPAGAYKPKRVKPKPPAPERTRLDIS